MNIEECQIIDIEHYNKCGYRVKILAATYVPEDGIVYTIKLMPKRFSFIRRLIGR